MSWLRTMWSTNHYCMRLQKCMTVLLLAADRDRASVVALLLDAEADVNLATTVSPTLLDRGEAVADLRFSSSCYWKLIWWVSSCQKVVSYEASIWHMILFHNAIGWPDSAHRCGYWRLCASHHYAGGCQSRCQSYPKCLSDSAWLYHRLFAGAWLSKARN
jgi:hypothetical protein